MQTHSYRNIQLSRLLNIHCDKYFENKTNIIGAGFTRKYHFNYSTSKINSMLFAVSLYLNLQDISK